MAVSGVSSSGLMSGLDVNGLVSQIIELEQRPISLLTLRQNDYELKISSVLSLSSKLSSYKEAIEKLNTTENFNTKSASITNSTNGNELLTVTASSTAAKGGYSIKVNQLATASKKSSQGFIDKSSTGIAAATGNFKFKVGSDGAQTNIVVKSTTTLQELADAINSTTAAVTATIVNDGTGSNPYRLMLTADDSGSANTVTIVTNDTTLDFTNKKVEAAYAYTTNTYAGTVASNDGDNYTGTTNKTFLVEAVTAGASATATYKYSVDGGINWLGYGGAAYDSTATDDTSGGAITTSTALKAIDGAGTANEGVTSSFSSGSDLAVGDRFTIDVFNPEMQEAKDAVIMVDNATIVKSSNSITDAIEGVTLDLLQADSTETLNLTVSSSSLEAKADIESFVESYNELYKFINEQLSYDPDDGTANPLLGDPTLHEIRSRISKAITGTIPGLTSSPYKSLSQVGITTDYKTGELEINSAKLTSALSANPDAVSKLFVGSATPSNKSLTYESKTNNTQAGTYSVSISEAPEQAIVNGDNDLSSTGLASEEILTFKYSINNTATDAESTAFSVTLSAGSTINSIVTALNSGFATNDAPFAASNNNGVLKVTSTEYGEDMWVKVTTNQGDAASQIWDASGSVEDSGVDIIGYINGHLATGLGNILTGSKEYSEEGLKISTTSSQTGLFGSISVSKGIADLLPTILDSYANEDSGILKSKEASMKSSIDDLESRIVRMESKIGVKETQLLAQFSRLEVLLSQYDATSQFLTNMFAAMNQSKN